MTILNNLKSKMKILWSKTWFKLFAFASVLLGCVYFIPIFVNGSVGSDFGDGMTQYRVYFMSFFNKINNGTFSFLDMNNFYGTSVFALEYYVPLDIFTLLMYLLTFIIGLNNAFAFVRLFMILCGVMLFYFVSRKTFKFDEKTSFVLSLIYLVNGGLAIYTTFYTYMGMYFYIPLLLYFLFEAHEKQKYLPLFVVTIIIMFYNFYLGYIIVAGSFLSLVVIRFIKKSKTIDTKTYVKLEIKQLIFDAIPILLGVFASSVIILPSILYITNFSSTNRDFGSSYTWKHYFEIIYGLLSAPSENNFGLDSDLYVVGQQSLYITVFGILSIINLICVNKTNRKKILCILGLEALLVSVPIFAQIFSASSGLYGRWYFSICLINIYLIGINFQHSQYTLQIVDNGKLKLTLLLVFSAVFFVYLLYVLNCNISIFENNPFSAISIGFSVIILFLLMKFKRYRSTIFKISIIFSVFIMFYRTIILPADVLYSTETSIQKNEQTLNDLENEFLYRTYVLSEQADYYNMNGITSGYTNEMSMYSSFYNTEINDFLTYYNYCDTADKWNYLLLFESSENISSFLGYKYFMINKENHIVVPEFLEYMFENDEYIYYLNKNYEGFGTVYYDFVNELSECSLINQASLNTYLYVEDGNDQETLKANYKNFEIESNDVITIDDNLFYIYDIENFETNTIYVCYNAFVNIKYKNGDILRVIDNTFVITEDIESIYIDSLSLTKDPNAYTSYFSSCNYDDYKAIMKKSNTEHANVSKNGDNFNITYNKTKSEKCIITLPITYAQDEFSCEYEIVKANGGFVGIVIPEGITGELNITLSYFPNGIVEGIKLTKYGLMLSLVSLMGYYIYTDKKKRIML